MSCGANFQSGSGNKIKVFAAILPECDRNEPKDVTVTATSAASVVEGTVILAANAFGAGSVSVTLTAAATAGATTLTVAALSRAIPSGTQITFNAGTANEAFATTTAAAAAGNTSLTTVALSEDIDNGSIGFADLGGDTTLTTVATTVDLGVGSQVTFNEDTDTEQTVTITAAAATGATTLTVEPLTADLLSGDTAEILPNTTLGVQPLSGAIAMGSRLTFNPGGGEVRAYLAKDVLAGATSIELIDLSGNIASGSVAKYTAKLRLLGGTSTGFNLNPNRTGIQVFEDEGGYEDGVITNATWEAPWSGNYLVDDESYERIKFATRRSPVDNREVYLWSEKPAPVGKTTGETDKGATLVTALSESLPADGVLTSSWTFSGQGTPDFDRAA